MTGTIAIARCSEIVRDTAQSTLSPETLKQAIQGIVMQNPGIDKSNIIQKIVATILVEAQQKCEQDPSFQALKAKSPSFYFNPNFYRHKVYERVEKEVNSLSTKGLAILAPPKDASPGVVTLLWQRASVFLATLSK